MTSITPVGGVKRPLCIKSRALTRPSVLMKKSAGFEHHPAGPGVCSRQHLVLLGSPGDPCPEALLPSEAGKDAVLLISQRKAREATLGV